MATTTKPRRTRDHDPNLTVDLIAWSEARRRGDRDAEASAVKRLRKHGVFLLVRIPGGKA